METLTIPQAVCLILRRDGQFLGVTRKDNHLDWGLVGGKVDPEDPSPVHAAIREAREETGLDVYNLQLVDKRVWGGYEQHCYLADYRGRIHFDATHETHLVEWVDAERLLAGCFGEYNGQIFHKLKLR